MFFVYILQNSAGSFYIGHSENLPERLQSHNDTGPAHGKFTRKNGPWQLVWREEHSARAAAMACAAFASNSGRWAWDGRVAAALGVGLLA